MKLAARTGAFPPSETLAVKARAAALAAAGRPVFDLSAGEPDGDPPPQAAQAAHASIDAGEHRYGPVPGLMALRSAIAERYQQRYDLDVAAGNVLVAHGGKQVLYELFQVLCDPGDEVVVIAPYWVSYLPQITLAGGVARVVAARPERGFVPDPADVAAVIGPRTRVLVLNSPNNPTGAVWDRATLRALMDLARAHDLWVISDELYDAIVYDGAEATCVASFDADAAARTITVHAVSKSQAMTGWRVGWMIGPPAVVGAMSTLQGHITSGVSLVSQRAALGAVLAPDEVMAPMRARFAVRRLRVLAGLAALPGVEVGPPPMGAFYVFPRVDGLFGRTVGGRVLGSASDVAAWFIDEAGVAVVPGEAFGEPRCVRISFAVADAVIEGGLDALARLLAG